MASPSFRADVALLGPPEIRRLAPRRPSAASSEVSSDRFLALMDAGFNAAAPRPLMGLTENLSPTFLSSGDPCLDFFFQIVPGTPAPTVAGLLGSAWAKDAATALKLACHLRGVRGTGKSDREGFYSSALWMHRHHPKTLALNLLPISGFGYLKDLPEILHRLVAGDDVREKAKAARPPRGPKRRGFGRRRFHFSGRHKSKKRQVTKKQGTKEERIAADLAKGKVLSAQAAEIRRSKRAEMAARAVERYARDPDYRFLHDRVADVFAELLSADLRNLGEGKLTKISLAAKWCPSLDSSYDLSILLCEAIARRLFPRDSHPDYASLEEEHYAYRVRDRLRREALVPLRRALELPEVYMSAGQWSVLPYNRVASVAMKNYKAIFTKHDRDRFAQYLSDVKKGTAKIAAGALLPHEILADAGDEVAELQWKRMVEDLAKKGSLSNCIAVCDVSGSMSGTPMEVCIALGLLISELSEDPWKGRVITFSERPQLHQIEGDSLTEKTAFIRTMEWGMNTDFQKVFDNILAVAVEGNLPREAMVRRVFVFSDMEFDVASANPWETDYAAVCRKFRKAGYGESVPEVVFWNLRDSRSTPVPSSQKGVALVSGFSKNLVKLFLEGDGILSPRAVMETAIAGKEYQKLMIFD
ncbi:uncharacterized protein LOC122037858 [Zingiber officinale]|uniref:Uncharacterized protein n=1 Tax=Zingiber officinale TaxID=94328 RepID=A0A8J5BTB5_ZINOF|nr:uncharacterized protein LOC122037858 [Zingiber officinale]KAG6466801.1 hypothetical protein ZIOFF_075391 [Zingiber officinale]